MQIGSFEDKNSKRAGTKFSLNTAINDLPLADPVGVRPFRMSKNNSELCNLFPELLSCFFCFFKIFLIFTHFVWNY